MLKRGMKIGLVAGLCAPFFANLLGMVLFNLPNGTGADVFWTATDILCPGWRLIDSLGTFAAISLLDSIIYALIGMAVAIGIRTIQRAR